MPDRRLLILFLCQALFWAIVIVGISSASLVGLQLAGNPAVATLPLAILTLGSILVTLPLSLIMQRRGRRFGFSLGALSAIVGGGVCCYGIYSDNFWLFCLGNLFLGMAQASALYYRLAAGDGVAPAGKGRAIAWVMSGGIAAAIIAPGLTIWSGDLFPAHLFAGSYALVGLMGVITLLLCRLLVDSPVSAATEPAENTRALGAIIRQPIFIAAITNTAISHSMMILIMVATPLAMLAHNYESSDSTYVIQWHVLGMFIPALFSGRLIDRFGASNISLTGTLILTISLLISLSDVQLLNFYSALLLLGIGWNLMYTAGSTLITQSHQSRERGRVQGIAELTVSSLAAIATFCSGALLHNYGWFEVNLGSIPLLLLAANVTLWFKHTQSRAQTLQ